MSAAHRYCVYLLTNATRSVLYTGITNDLRTRLHQHIQSRGNPKTFTGRYQCYLLVYFEYWPDPTAAIAREKEIKLWNRAKKNTLVEQLNPTWQAIDLETWTG
ncbi:GIY-YIG nuclease family protein [Hymenobacter sp. ASUV-10]|uniref:GIY-YIG nuclease family protein n=1 Tax=Hymenobacter aranciens TaxID=3063996 RepID=A0ABT9BCA9_9BACT|nr:GIY-YIG nuclease family protein [Hymenobacter sp. ASUV-10]MDO7875883.1 GIY-YIG nuclease family protein [Hymenobacter sp. ASUV-10]